MLIVLIVVTGALFTPLVVSLLTNRVTLKTSGQIILPDVTANSGSASDIQAAVDFIAANIGVGNVHIPEGTWNFVEVGESWQTVTVPAGINICGTPTMRDADNQVVEWETVLVMPWDVPSGAIWFRIVGASDPNEPSRFSDIKLMGYRCFDANSITLHTAVHIYSVIDYRIDHCSFANTTGGLTISGHYCCGVIDHCRLVNGVGAHAPYGEHDIEYGVHIVRGEDESEWDSDLSNIVGHYTDYTTFIEDCYFSDWRHCVVNNWGSHYVLRHSVIQYDNGYGSVDAHNQFNPPYHGGRAIELYETSITESTATGWDMASTFRSGGGCFFNNYVRNHSEFIRMEGQADELYVWDNDFEGYALVAGDKTEGVEYFLYEPEWYTPYTYPHPLTLEATP